MRPWWLRIDRALPGTPPSVKCAPAASSWGSKDRSAPRNGRTLEGVGENARNSPMHGGVPSLSVTSIFTYRARSVPRSGQYTGLPAGGVCCWRSGTGCSEFGSVPALMLASAVVAVSSRVSPKPLSVRTLPRSTVTLPVHWVAHHCVEASPSIACGAGDGGDGGDPEDPVAVPTIATFNAVAYGCDVWLSCCTTRWARPWAALCVVKRAAACELAAAATPAPAHTASAQPSINAITRRRTRFRHGLPPARALPGESPRDVSANTGVVTRQGTRGAQTETARRWLRVA